MQNRPILVNFHTGINSDMVKNIIDTVSGTKIESATVYAETDEILVDEKIRKCKVTPLQKTHWINGLLDYYVRSVNNEVYDYDLIGWHADLQFLHYKGKGSGYVWHCDNGAEENDYGVRKLTVILGLSDPNDYEGGELQVIMPGTSRQVNRLKLNLGECVIFPSTSLHRVTPLKSGERSVIVGWYGGPDFR